MNATWENKDHLNCNQMEMIMPFYYAPISITLWKDKDVIKWMCNYFHAYISLYILITIASHDIGSNSGMAIRQKNQLILKSGFFSQISLVKNLDLIIADSQRRRFRINPDSPANFWILIFHSEKLCFQIFNLNLNLKVTLKVQI